jgi:phosphinothricin acetyltransferase
MAIRPVRADDFEAIAAMTNHYIATTAIHFGYEPVSGDELRATWQAKSTYPWLVDDDGGAVRAYAKGGVWRDRAAYQWTVETGIYVDAAAVGRRIGSALYAALLDELARGGFRSAVAGITLPNEPSVRLHERLGFQPVGVFREAGYKHGAWHDVGWYQRTLA